MNLLCQGHVRFNWIRIPGLSGLLIAVLSTIGCEGCDGSSPDGFTRIDLSGIIEEPIILGARTEVLVAEDLVFSSTADSALVLTGATRFLVEPQVRIILPRGLILPSNARVSFSSAGSDPWRGLEFASGRLALDGVDVRDCVLGLKCDSSQFVSIVDCSFKDIEQTAVQAINVDTLRLTESQISSAGRYGLFLEYNCPNVEVTACTIDRCREGIRVNRSQLRVFETYFHDCISYAIYAHLEISSVIEHCDFSNNTTHLWFQNTRNLTVRWNDLVGSSDFPIKVVQRSGTVVVAENNIQPNSSGYLVNLETGDLDATNNYWHSTDAATIAAGMYDGHIVPNRGVVSYVPFLTSPVLTAGRTN